MKMPFDDFAGVVYTPSGKVRFQDGYMIKPKRRECKVRSVEECKKIYGLDNGDVEYNILEIEEIRSWENKD